MPKDINMTTHFQESYHLADSILMCTYSLGSGNTSMFSLNASYLLEDKFYFKYIFVPISL